MTTLTQKPATKGQIRQISRVGSDAVEKAVEEFGLDKAGAQLVHSRGDELAAMVREAMVSALRQLSVTNQFADEEVPCNYGYLSGYAPGQKSVAEQIKRLRELLPELGAFDWTLAAWSDQLSLPSSLAEQYFAIPRW